MPAQFGTFDDLLAMTAPDLRLVATGLREAILAGPPNATEVVRLGDRAASYGQGPKKMSEANVYILPHANWVNLGFYQGAVLDDPEDLLEGTGARLRHVKMRSLTDTGRAGVAGLIAAAKAECAGALGL